MVDLLHQYRYIEAKEAAMALNIKNPEVESLAAEIASITGETKTEAIRRALQERKNRIMFRVARKDVPSRVTRFLEQEVWPLVPAGLLGRPLSRDEEDRILGFDEEGV
jgi:antitoxin VapB